VQCALRKWQGTVKLHPPYGGAKDTLAYVIVMLPDRQDNYEFGRLEFSLIAKPLAIVACLCLYSFSTE
jgi:hypothetical protein